MLLVESTQQFWLPGYRSLRSPRIRTLREWISTAEYRIESTPRRSASNLFVDTSTTVVDALGSEFNRFICASLESNQAMRVDPARPNAAGWIVIQQYYSAYFAANALMRLFGYFSTNVEQANIAEINSVAGLYGLPMASEKTKLIPGVYFGKYLWTGTDFLVRLELMQHRGGVHTQFWASFLRFLQDLTELVRTRGVLVKADRVAAEGFLLALAQALKQRSHASADWLSAVRNAVNYRLEHGVWHPYLSSTESADQLLSIFSNASGRGTLLPYRESASEISSFADVCGYIVGWARASARQLRFISTAGRRHFLDHVMIP